MPKLNSMTLKSSASGVIVPQDQRLTPEILLPTRGDFYFVGGVGSPTRTSALQRLLKKDDCLLSAATYSRKEEKTQFISHWKAFSLKFDSKQMLDSVYALLKRLPLSAICPDGKNNVFVVFVFDRDYENEEVQGLLNELKDIFAGKATVTPRVPWNEHSRKTEFFKTVTPSDIDASLQSVLEGARDKKKELQGDVGQGRQVIVAPEASQEVLEGEKADGGARVADETLRFIKEITPPECGVINIRQFGKNTGMGGEAPIQKFFEMAEEAAEFVRDHSALWDTYLATATFRDRTSAKEENFHSACSCPIDFDVAKASKEADAKHYATKGDALQGMQYVNEKLFAKAEGGSPLLIVDSGNGIQAHVILNEIIDAAIRRRLGTKIEKVCIALGHKPDPAVTKDPVRIMRVPGTFNYKGYKDGVEPKPVSVLKWNKGKISPSALEAQLDELLRELASSSAGMGGVGGLVPFGNARAGAEGLDDVTKNLLGDYNKPFHLGQNWTAIESLLAFADYESEDHWRWMLKFYKGAEELPETQPEDLQRYWGKFVEWSRQSEDFKGEEQQRQKMAEQRSEHPRVVFSHFQGLGWNNPGSDAFSEPAANADSALADLGVQDALIRAFPQDNIAHGEMFAKAAKREGFRYTARGWYAYTDGIWRLDDAAATEFGKKLAKALKDYSRTIQDEEKQKLLMQHQRHISTSEGLNKMLKMAKTDPLVHLKSLEVFDADPMMFQLANGVLDLRTGTVVPCSPDYMMTKQSRVAFDAGAQCPKWLKFLDETFPNDPETIESLQRYAGYAMSGLVKEEVVCFWQGKGSNGKSTINTVFTHIFGDYRISAPSGLVIQRTNNDPKAPDPMLAATVGARMVVVNEMPKNARMDEQAIKQIGGTDTVSVREPFDKRPFQFKPTAKLIVSLNDMPRAADMGQGLWRRIRVIPFATHIDDSRKNLNLANELIEESSGILNWLIEGCQKWFKDGLKWSAACNEAVQQYQRDTDTLSTFMDKYEITADKDHKISQPDMWRAYTEATVDFGERIRKQTFYSMIGERHGVTRARSHGTDWFEGIRERKKAA